MGKTAACWPGPGAKRQLLAAFIFLCINERKAPGGLLLPWPRGRDCLGCWQVACAQCCLLPCPGAWLFGARVQWAPVATVPLGPPGALLAVDVAPLHEQSWGSLTPWMGKSGRRLPLEKEGAVSLAGPGMMLLQDQLWSWCSAVGTGAGQGAGAGGRALPPLNLQLLGSDTAPCLQHPKTLILRAACTGCRPALHRSSTLELPLGQSSSLPWDHGETDR